MESNGPHLHEHLEKLRQFVSTAERGSFSAAANDLHVSQPTISHNIKVLESILGAELLLRTSRGVKLTAAGEILLNEGRKLLSHSNQIESAIRKRNFSPLPVIEIGTKEPYAVHLFPNYLKHLERKMPDTSISLTIRRSNEELLRMLLEESLDAILIPDPPTKEQIVAYELGQDEYRLFVSGEAEDRSAGSVIYLFRHALCGGGKRIYEILEEFPSAARIKDVDSFEAARAMSLNGMGLALLPRLLVREDVKSRRLTYVNRKDFPTHCFGTLRISLCLHAKHAKETAYRKFIRNFLQLRENRKS